MASLLGNHLKLMASAIPATAVDPLLVGTTGMGPPDGAIRIPVYSADLTAIGDTIERTFVSWDSVNPSNGTFNWTYRQGGPDSWVAANRASGRKLIIQPIFSPAWWQQGAGTTWPHSVDGRVYADMPPYPSADWDFWLSKLVLATQAMVTHYSDNDLIWEPGNEWNNAGIYHRPGGLVVAMTPQNYAAYFAAQAIAGRAINPNQKWIIGGLFRVDSAPAFGGNGNMSGIATLAPMKTALDAAGVTPDGVSIHPYLLGAPNSDPTIDRWPNAIGINSWQSVKRTLDEMDRIGWHLPVYITETGFRASVTNAQNAFNCNSEVVKSVWNRFEHDNTYFELTKAARGPGKAHVAAIMYYRDQDYPASLYSPSFSGCLPGDPDVGPHALTIWGLSKQDFNNRIKNRIRLTTLEGMTLTGVPATVVVGSTAATISAAGTNMDCVPTFLSTDPTVVSVTAPATGSSSTTIQFLTAGKATVKAQSKNARGVWISAVQTIDVQAAIATLTTISPSVWKVATSNGGTIQFVANVKDQLGNPMTASGTWTSSDPTKLSIDPVTGFATALAVLNGVTVTFTPDTGSGGGRIGTATGDVVLNPVLQILNPPTNLFQFGAVALQVTDGVNPVTGFTVVISDGTKATANGSDLIGKGTAGSFNLSVSKSGLTTSVINAVTCSSNCLFDDKDAIGQADNTSLASYADSDGITWAQANGAVQPKYRTNVINGHSTVQLDGTTQFLQATATHPRLNGAGVMYMALIRPSNAAPTANEQILDNRDVANQQGFVMGRNASAPNVGASVLTYYRGGATSQQFDGTKMPTGAFYRDSIRIKNGRMERMINGVIQSTVGTDAVYSFPTHTQLPTKGRGIGGGNFFAGDLGCETLCGRAPTDEEWYQADYYQQIYATAPAINPAILHHLTLLISSTSATVGGAVPTLTVQKWADAAETTPCTASVTLSYTSGTPATATVVSGTGVITLVAAGTTAFTVTDSISGKSDSSPTLTVSASGSDGPSLSGLAFLYDDYSYANNAAFQAVISAGIGGAGGGVIKYADGANGQWASLDTGKKYNGHNTAKYIFPALTGGACELWAPFGSTKRDVWFRGSLYFKPTFHSDGTIIGSSSGYKILAWGLAATAAPIIDGSGRIEATGGPPGSADHYDFYWGYSIRSNGHQGGGVHLTLPANLLDHWSQGKWIHYYLHMDYTALTSGTVDCWIAENNGTPVHQGQIGGGTTGIDGEDVPGVNYINIGLNFNQNRAAGQDLEANWGEWECVDGSVHANPFGL